MTGYGADAITVGRAIWINAGLSVLPRFAALGAGGGLLLFGLLAINAWQAWSVSDAIANATLLVLLGGGSATGTLMLARRAGPALKSGDESRSLGEGEGRGHASRGVLFEPPQ